MRLARTGWSWITAAIVVGVAVCLVPGQVHAWTEYRDDFSTNKAEEDSYLHSIYWPQGAFPPSESYLYHSDTGQQQELGFGDYNGEPALLGYCFPVSSVQSHSAVSGYLNIDIRFQDTTDLVSGSLQYSLSDDGVIWSSARQLGPGRHNIPLESVSGVCYVKFRGTEVLIDNIEVFLSSSPATIEVPRDFATIQQAIDAAAYGDIVEVSSGTYTGDGNWDIDFKGKAITVRSSSGPGQTIIDCAGNEGHRGFYFHQGEGQNSVLRGFTIIGALVSGSEIPSDNSWSSSPSHPIGGGIYCEYSSPSIIDCVIRQCAAELGGGIGSVGGAPAIIDCKIEECSAGGLGPAESGGYGAGIGLIKGSDARIVNCTINRNIGYDKSFGAGVYCWQSRLMLAGCDISFNSAQGNVTGGGLYCGGSSAQATLERCIVSNNTAEAGGGVFSDSYARTNITNCTIADNKLSAPQKALGGGVHADASYIAIRNSIVWDNDGSAVLLDGSLSASPVLYSNIEGYYPGQGNIDSEPMFASAGNDYHLRSILGRFDSGQWVTDSINSHSPCIDAGDPQDPIGSEPFPNNKRINMGAYGGTSEASKSIGPLIFHVDGSRGSKFNSGLSKDEAFATIQYAVDWAEDGDTIMVWPGTYREAVFVIGKAITIQSADDAAVIMAPANDPIAFTFQFAESLRCVLRNFVITNCAEMAILCSSASPELANLTIVDNQSGIASYDGSDPSITNCIFWNNKFGDLEQCRARYSCLGSLEPGDADLGNISEDPIFADINNDDYHLQSKYGRYLPNGSWTTDSQTSPCIDKGDPGMYTGREQKPHAGRVNMGAYGGTPFASKSGPSW